MDRKAVRIVIVLVAIAVLAIAFEQTGKGSNYALRHEVCTAWSTPDVYNADFTPVTPAACVNFVQRFYPWAISFSLVAVAVIAVAGAAWVTNERRN